MRALFLVHRYLGIGVGILMAVWCLSGVVMMYVPYPQLSQLDRQMGLAPIDWTRIHALTGATLPAESAAVDRFELEMIAELPVLRLTLSDGTPRVIGLSNSKLIQAIGPDQAVAAASEYALRHQLIQADLSSDRIDFDQWTVGGFRGDRPLYRVRLNDPRGNELYVSSHTGKLIQGTTRWKRFWGWVGAVPHWLYPSILRQHPEAWSGVVVYTSLVGIFLTATGLFIGVRQYFWGKGGAARRSPYTGVTFWHHVPGLIFGVLTLTWVTSGMLSMNPWGLMEGGDVQSDRSHLTGRSPTFGQVRDLIEKIRVNPIESMKSLRSASLDGRLFVVATLADGSTRRLDAQGIESKLSPLDIEAAAVRLAGNNSTWRIITEPDAYHYSLMEQRAILPAVRIESAGTHDFYYLDAVSGELINLADSAGKQYRWWHSALHRLDFSPAFRASSTRTLLMLPLLLGAALVSATGAFIGLRRLFR